MEGSGGGLGEVLGVLEGILGALPPKKLSRIAKVGPKSFEIAPRSPRRPPKGFQETFHEAPEAIKMSFQGTLKKRLRNLQF